MKRYKTNCPHIHAVLVRENTAKGQVKSSADSATFIRQLFIDMDVRESMYAVFLNQANNTVGWYEVGVGGINYCPADTRLMWNAALRCGATSLFVAHNHPSGNLTPSEADKQLCKRIQEQGKIMEIQLIDNLILTETSYYSFVDEGLL